MTDKELITIDKNKFRKYILNKVPKENREVASGIYVWLEDNKE